MQELKTKYENIKIFAKTLEQEALSQIIQFSNSLLGENAHIRIMPDAHAGAGCTIGTTMIITNKVCSNLVGVDIGCGVDLAKTNIDFSTRLQELDEIIHKYIPSGKSVHDNGITYNDLLKLKCWKNLHKDTQETAFKSLGTLGGGNHFLEAYKDGYISVHSGSRNIGFKVAQYYQKQAKKQISEKMSNLKKEQMLKIEPQKREQWLKENQQKIAIDNELAYLTDDLMQDYLHDIKILQQFASENRKTMLNTIINKMGGKILDYISSVHNYIDVSNPNLIILRKGAISAQLGEKLVIPLNMRDGLLICVGKGNEDWNYSAPHGAGRLYSRSKAKEIFNVDDFQKTMSGIYSTTINQSTLDECPFAYKNYEEIMETIQDTVEIQERIIPIYNFKASE
jgi:tRNA-splicing ligase RtcB (3'-phosphate/5'-hydroxy nucleic acid ligase)